MEIQELGQVAASITAIKTRTDKTMHDHHNLSEVVNDLIERVKALEAAAKAEEHPAKQKAAIAKKEEPAT